MFSAELYNYYIMLTEFVALEFNVLSNYNLPYMLGDVYKIYVSFVKFLWHGMSGDEWKQEIIVNWFNIIFSCSVLFSLSCIFQVIVKLIAFRLKFFTHKFEVSFVLITREMEIKIFYTYLCRCLMLLWYWNLLFWTLLLCKLTCLLLCVCVYVCARVRSRMCTCICVCVCVCKATIKYDPWIG